MQLLWIWWAYVYKVEMAKGSGNKEAANPVSMSMVICLLRLLYCR